MPVSDCFGAGTCGKYLTQEFMKRGRVFNHLMGECLDDEPLSNVIPKTLTSDVDIPLIQFAGSELEQQTKYRGSPNVAYIFSEWEPITEEQKRNLRAFDVLVAGSEWNARVIRDAGFECAAVPQGVDRAIFRPLPRTEFQDRFVIYSGGKFEYRKAQDLVIRAVKILQERHPDILLVSSWFNIFGGNDGMTEALSAGIDFVPLPLLNHRELARRMAQTNVGLFPNRREGGTNLILMDYLAMGKPVIANVSTGQRDVLHESYARMIEGDDDALVDQMVEHVEALYIKPDEIERMGAAASVVMHGWSWSRTAEGLLEAIRSWESKRESKRGVTHANHQAVKSAGEVSPEHGVPAL